MNKVYLSVSFTRSFRFASCPHSGRASPGSTFVPVLLPEQQDCSLRSHPPYPSRGSVHGIDQYKITVGHNAFLQFGQFGGIFIA